MSARRWFRVAEVVAGLGALVLLWVPLSWNVAMAGGPTRTETGYGLFGWRTEVVEYESTRLASRVGDTRAELPPPEPDQTVWLDQRASGGDVVYVRTVGRAATLHPGWLAATVVATLLVGWLAVARPAVRLFRTPGRT